MIKQIAKQFIKNIKNGNPILSVSRMIVGQVIGAIIMYFLFHWPIYDIFIGIIITAFIFLLLISIKTISQLVFKSKKNN